MAIDMGSADLMSVHIHPRHAELGINYQYWVRGVFQNT